MTARVDDLNTRLRHFLVGVECVKKSGHGLGRCKMWLSLFAVCLAIAICLVVGAIIRAINNPGESFPG